MRVGFACSSKPVLLYAAAVQLSASSGPSASGRRILAAPWACERDSRTVMAGARSNSGTAPSSRPKR